MLDKLCCLKATFEKNISIVGSKCLDKVWCGNFTDSKKAIVSKEQAAQIITSLVTGMIYKHNMKVCNNWKGDGQSLPWLVST